MNRRFALALALAPAPDPAGGDVYYENCAAVWAAGAAPFLAGQPGYSRVLDRDGGGIGCENYGHQLGPQRGH